MKHRAQTTLLQLPEELVKHILLLLAMAKDGAKEISQVLLVSKNLREMALDDAILRSMSISKLPDTESFWKGKGLIVKSARARNRKTYKKIMKKIKEKIDGADSLDYIMPLLEEWSAKVKGRGVCTRSLSKPIREVLMKARSYMVRTNLDLMRARLMINKFGRQYFQSPDLILLNRYDCQQSKFDKCGSMRQSLNEFVGGLQPQYS